MKILYKLCIFDLDGTLLDTIDDISDSMNHILSLYNYPLHDAETYKSFVGNGVSSLVCHSLPKDVRNEGVISNIQAQYSQWYSGHSRIKTKPYCKIIDVLQILKRRGMKLAMCSNKPHTPTCELADIYFPDIFDCVYGNMHGMAHKPDPAIIFEIMKRLESESKDTALIGDSDIDMKTAKAAGILAVGVTWGYRSRDILMQSGADKIISAPLELLDETMR